MASEYKKTWASDSTSASDFTNPYEHGRERASVVTRMAGCSSLRRRSCLGEEVFGRDISDGKAFLELQESREFPVRARRGNLGRDNPYVFVRSLESLFCDAIEAKSYSCRVAR